MTDAKSASPKSAGHPVKSLPRPQVNLGNFHGHARAVEESPTFSLQKGSAPVVEEDAGKLLRIGRVLVAIRRPVHLSWYRPGGEGQLGRDQLYHTRQVLNR
jgi:hypothetical protein